MIYPVLNIDDNETLYFSASSPYDAMTKLKYYLGLKHKDASTAAINKTETNSFLFAIIGGKTYSVKL